MRCSAPRCKALYVTGEESGAQVALRSRRLGLGAAQVRVLAEIQLEKILATIDAEQPAVAVIDSIQTVYRDAADLGARLGGAGARMRRAADARWPRRAAPRIVLVGHVTKEGALAGPRVLEHIVDTVLYFEGDTHSSFRLVRAIKNRFGAVNEIGVFAMTEKGLKGVGQPERDLPVAARRAGAGQRACWSRSKARGRCWSRCRRWSTAAGPARAGSRSAWTATAWRCCWRCCTAMPASPAIDQDVFVNAVGGVRISEPAADLAVMLAIQSSLRGKPLPAASSPSARSAWPARCGRRRAARSGCARRPSWASRVAIVPKANAPRKGSRRRSRA